MSFPYLRHPVVLASLCLTFLNDQYLKFHCKEWFANSAFQKLACMVTGKLSDVCGLFFFPLFLYALIEFITKPNGTHQSVNIKKLIMCIVVTDVLFVLFKITDARIYLVEYFSYFFFNIQIVPDATDLLALPVQFGTYALARRYSNKKAQL